MFLKKILLVDHEAALTEFVRRALERTGKFLVKVERDENVACSGTRWFVPDLVLLDGIVPELSRVPAHAFNGTPIVYLNYADRAQTRIATHGSIAGYDFLTSSVRLEELTEWLCDLISGGGTTR